ncbi:MAG: alpha/beta hydrolase [Planctomycetota bacterium]|nr:alpha/beta hydrolase [Planctomycetota bacterium]
MKQSYGIGSWVILLLWTPGIQVLSADESWVRIIPDVVYGHKDGLAMTYDVIQPGENRTRAAVLFMVSGGWVSRWLPPEQVVRQKPPRQKNLFEKIVSSGYTLILVRHGSSPRYKVPEAVRDVRQAIQHVHFTSEKLGIDPERIGVCGGSAGGHLSLMLGTTGKKGIQPASIVRSASSRVRAVVAYFPPTFLKGYVGDPGFVKQFPALDFELKEVEKNSPLSQVSSDDAPTLLIHGDRDELVPLVHSQKIAKAFEKAGVEHRLMVIKGAAHGFTGEDGQRAESALIEWFDRYLKK